MANSTIDESDLIERARSDRKAFGDLYELHVDRIYNYLYYRTGNQHDAEDLTARVFFRAIQHVSHYQDRGAPFAAWLFSIARNMLANWYRDSGRMKLVPLEVAGGQEGEVGPELTFQLGQDKEALLAAIRNLPPDRQDLLILKFVERMSNAEIGLLMGRSEGAIKSLYHRTLVSLRASLSQVPVIDQNGGGNYAYRDG
jgi:RNA polymerase sigma-70 factor (ECF subfamily)